MKKKTKLRAIDQGTVYDIPGKLINLARQVRSGELQGVSDVMVVAKTHEKDGYHYHVFGFGCGEPAVQHHMLATGAKRLIDGGRSV